MHRNLRINNWTIISVFFFYFLCCMLNFTILSLKIKAFLHHSKSNFRKSLKSEVRRRKDMEEIEKKSTGNCLHILTKISNPRSTWMLFFREMFGLSSSHNEPMLFEQKCNIIEKRFSVKSWRILRLLNFPFAYFSFYVSFASEIQIQIFRPIIVKFFLLSSFSRCVEKTTTELKTLIEVDGRKVKKHYVREKKLFTPFRGHSAEEKKKPQKLIFLYEFSRCDLTENF